jgi:hypothetical protein
MFIFGDFHCFVTKKKEGSASDTNDFLNFKNGENSPYFKEFF